MNQLKTALVTGAGSGIGRAAAILLAQAGYHLALVARTRAALEETAQQAGASTGVECQILTADVSDPRACAAVVAAVEANFGRLDALVNAAGYASLCPIDRITPREWRRTIDTNLTAVVCLTAAAWPLFRRQNAGIVVNVSSLASVDPFPGFALYAPAKAGVNMFTHCAAGEGAAIGVRAVAIAPGAVETPMLRSMFDAQALPPQRTMPPEQVAAAIRDCVTGTRAFENGQTILMPGP